MEKNGKLSKILLLLKEELVTEKFGGLWQKHCKYTMPPFLRTLEGYYPILKT